MALFNRTKKSTSSVKEKAAGKTSVPMAPTNHSGVIMKPRLTEKAVSLGEQNVYAFVVAPRATKRDVAAAVKTLFGVTPTDVRIVNRAPRAYHSRSKSRTMTEQGLKKAYVSLKKGDSISIV